MPAASADSKSGPRSIASQMRVMTARGFHYFCVATDTTVAATAAAIDGLMARLQAARERGGLRTEGPVVLVYGAGVGDAFHLEAGYAVPADTAPAGEAIVRQVESRPCACLLYWGGLADYSNAQLAVMDAIRDAGLTPGDGMREWCLNWDGDDSDNNVILFQHSLAR